MRPQSRSAGSTSETFHCALLRFQQSDGVEAGNLAARMAHACAQIKSQDIELIVFGDPFLADIRAYREEQLAAAGTHGVFPLWQRDTAVLAQTMIASGLVAHIVCLDPRRLDRRFAGRRFDDALLRELPETVDPCGENG